MDDVAGRRTEGQGGNVVSRVGDLRQLSQIHRKTEIQKLLFPQSQISVILTTAQNFSAHTFKTASLSQFTLHINGDSHGINQVFGNSHSKIKSLFYNPSSDFHPISRLSYYSQFSRTSFSLFISNGFARCPFIPVFLASCTSSANALAVMAIIGSFPCSPGRLLIAAVAS